MVSEYPNWLLINGRILTWEQLESRGFHGPSRYVLCKRSVEDIQHLFLTCPFTVKIFSFYAARFEFTLPCFDFVLSLLVHWFSTTALFAVFRYLPIFAYWCIWNLRNKCLFEDRKPSVQPLISMIESFLKLFPVPLKSQKIRIIGPKP